MNYLLRLSLVVLCISFISCDKNHKNNDTTPDATQLSTTSQMNLSIQNIDLPAGSSIVFAGNLNNEVGYIDQAGNLVMNSFTLPNYFSEDSTEYVVSQFDISKDLELGTFHYLTLKLETVTGSYENFSGAILLDIILPGNGGLNNAKNQCNIDLQTVSTTHNCQGDPCECCGFTYHGCGEIKGCYCCAGGGCNHSVSTTSKFFRYVGSLTI